MPADEQLLQGAEVVDQAVDDGGREPGDLGQQAVAARSDGAVEVLAVAEAQRPGRGGGVESSVGGERLEPVEHRLGAAGPASAAGGSRG